MKRRLLIGVSAIVLAATDGSVAADLNFLPVNAPAPATMPVWAGFYVGIAAGGAFGPSNAIAGGPLRFGPLTNGYDVAGGLIGGTVGYNFQSGSWVYGLEGDLSWADVVGRAEDTLPSNPQVINTTREHWLSTGRARLGWTTPNGVLLYVTGGVAVAGVEATISGPGGFFLSQTNTRWGGTVGAGAEAMLSPGWSAKAEYLYVALPSSTYFPSPPVGTNIRSDVPFDEHIFRFGLNYHFGEAAPNPMYVKAPFASAMPMASPAASWTGLYLGGEAGGGFGPSNAIGGGPGLFGPLTIGYNISGAVAGATIGYNLQSGHWVYGPEGDFSWADLEGQANNGQPNTQAINVTQEHWLATGRGRLGWATQNGVLLYATGGFAVASIEANLTGNVAFHLSQTNTRWGGTVGAGAETMFARAWSAKAEYLFVDLERSSYFPNPPPNYNTRADVPVEEHIFRFGVNYHFGQ